MEKTMRTRDRGSLAFLKEKESRSKDSLEARKQKLKSKLRKG